jgi:hypothetical protein
MKKFEIYRQFIPYLDLHDGKTRPLVIVGEIQNNKIIGNAIYTKKAYWSEIPGIFDLLYHPYDTKVENLAYNSYIDISRFHDFDINHFDTKHPIGEFTPKDIGGFDNKSVKLLALKNLSRKNDPERIFDFLTLLNCYAKKIPFPGHNGT